MITDHHGVIGQIQSDGSVEGGDSINWMGHWAYHEDIPGWPVSKIISKFEVSPGAYVRHFDPEQTYYGFGAYYKSPWHGCMSRDQLTGLIGMLVKHGEVMALLRMITHHMCWLMLFSYNTRTNGTKTPDWKWPDFTGPDIWAMYLRGFGKVSKLFYPILLILDLHLLINVVLTNRETDEDVISLMMKYQVSQEFTPTSVSKLADQLMDKELMASKLDSYWSGWRQQPRMAELMKRSLTTNGR